MVVHFGAAYFFCYCRARDPSLSLISILRCLRRGKLPVLGIFYFDIFNPRWRSHFSGRYSPDKIGIARKDRAAPKQVRDTSTNRYSLPAPVKCDLSSEVQSYFTGKLFNRGNSLFSILIFGVRYYAVRFSFILLTIYNYVLCFLSQNGCF